MPKILFINSCLGVGSTGRIIESIGTLATKEGWECHIAHGARYVGKSSLISHPVVSILGEYIHYVHSLLLDKHGLSSTYETRRLINVIKKISPDIIHLHCIHGYYLNYKVLFEFLNSTNIPVVWTFHDCWSFTGHCAHFVTADCNKWMTECMGCSLTRDYPKSLVDCSKRNYKIKKYLFTANKNLTIVTVSKWLKSISQKSFFHKYPINVIYNGVDTSIFYPKSDVNIPCITDDIFVVMGVATQWKEGKGLEDYIKLSFMLSRDEKIVLVGISEELSKSLPQNIIGIKRTNSQQELSSLYNRADVVLSLSSAETFGLTIAEGFACGTPAIVYNNTALPELITEDTGFVVENHNLEEVYQKIETIKINGKSMYSKACRLRALTEYDKHKRYMDYVDLYNRLIRE